MAVVETVATEPARESLGERTLDMLRRKHAWDAIMPFSASMSGIAGVFTSGWGWPVMVPVMVGVFLVTAVTWRLLWVD